MEALMVASQEIKQATPDYPIHPLLQQRWSPRAFASQLVEEDKLRSMLEAARWSASAANSQPWHFFVATKSDEERYAKLASTLNPQNAEWAALAPALIMVVAKIVRDNGQPNPYGWHDAGLATQNLILQATALGLHVHPMAGFSADRARELYGIPEGFQPVSMLAVGYLGDPEQLDEKRRLVELTPRSRKPLSEFVFTDGWGRVADLVK